MKKKLKKQNDAMFKYHDLLQSLKKTELQLLLEYNKQEIPEGSSRVRITNFEYLSKWISDLGITCLIYY